jgi:hypothetical protein
VSTADPPSALALCFEPSIPTPCAPPALHPPPPLTCCFNSCSCAPSGTNLCVSHNDALLTTAVLATTCPPPASTTPLALPPRPCSTEATLCPSSSLPPWARRPLTRASAMAWGPPRGHCSCVPAAVQQGGSTSSCEHCVLAVPQLKASPAQHSSCTGYCVPPVWQPLSDGCWGMLAASWQILATVALLPRAVTSHCPRF